ncbi:hypothetical protein WJX73_006082 [Symbiochloris irregularis]|uniref:Septin-type G domain-containing protein n=1 Tax=Symbiochloris irregularis TaxID=706552 RepID=A0AAW1P9A4_9CHLO
MSSLPQGYLSESEQRAGRSKHGDKEGTSALQEAQSRLTASRPRPHKPWQHRPRKFVKFLIVGDSGLGKTTLVRTLFSLPGQELQLHDGTETSPAQWKRDPESLCTVLSWEDSEDAIWVYQVQDTPGYGDDLNIMNNIKAMIKYIEDQNRKFLTMELDKQRTVDITELPDPRVDCCIFCLQPHRLRPIDLRYMLELGQHVPIVPVVTKADTMTIQEAAKYRREVYMKLKNPYVPGVKALSTRLAAPINVLQFEDETLERCGLQHTDRHTMPFLVVASNEVSSEMSNRDPPVFWPERQYKWGISEAFNPEHSDLMYLRRLLTEDACDEIAAAKRKRYQLWRRAVLNQRRISRRVVRVLWLALIPVAAGLVIKHSHTSPKQLVRNIKSWRPHKQLKHLKPTTASVFGGAEEEQDVHEDEDLEDLRAKGDHHGKKFFWF